MWTYLLISLVKNIQSNICFKLYEYREKEWSFLFNGKYIENLKLILRNILETIKSFSYIFFMKSSISLKGTLSLSSQYAERRFKFSH